MQGFDLIRGTLMLMKTLHENPESGAVIHDPSRPVDLREQVRLAPKTKEQIDAAIAECDSMKTLVADMIGAAEKVLVSFKTVQKV